jgi:prolyl 4-hydroxylase
MSVASGKPNEGDNKDTVRDNDDESSKRRAGEEIMAEDSEDDSEYNYETESDEEDDDSHTMGNDDDGYAMKQHAMALLIGFVASIVGYYLINPDVYHDVLSWNFSSLWLSTGSSALASNASRRNSSLGSSSSSLSASQQRLLEAQQRDGPAYKRTWGVEFCLPTRPELREDLYKAQDHAGQDSSSDRDRHRNRAKGKNPLFCTSRITESLVTEMKENKQSGFQYRFAHDILTGRSSNIADPQMKYSNITVPKKLVPALLEHYAEDYPSLWQSLATEENPLKSYEATTAEFIPVKMYMEPTVDSFYRNPEAREILAMLQYGEKQKGGYDDEEGGARAPSGEFDFENPTGDAFDPNAPLQEVEPYFLGFAAKIINLSHKSVDCWWDGGYTEDEEGRTIKQDIKVATIPPFEAVGTASFPGHQFYLTPTYDKSDHMDRFILTNEDGQSPIHAFDPFENPPTGSGVTQYQLGRLTKEQRRKYDMHKLNSIFGRGYQVSTGRPWYGMFPRPPPAYHMWQADYFGQNHTVVTSHSHYQAIPPKKLLPFLNSDTMASRELAQHVPMYQREGDMTLNLTVMSCRPRVFEIQNFLSEAEVDHLLQIGQEEGRLQKSTVSATGDVTGAENQKNTRSSSNAWIYREQSPIVDTIYRRAADLLMVDESLLRDHWTDEDSGQEAPLRSKEDGELKLHQEWSGRAEALQLVHYKEGQMYTAHHDFMFPEATSPYQPTRFATILLYLNGGDEDDLLGGGQTAFPRGKNAESANGLMVTPRKGKAVLFYNMLPDGNMDDLSQHASMPVKSGEKWLANLWVWDPVVH